MIGYVPFVHRICNIKERNTVVAQRIIFNKKVLYK